MADRRRVCFRCAKRIAKTIRHVDRWLRRVARDSSPSTGRTVITAAVCFREKAVQRFLILNGDKTTASGAVVAMSTTIQLEGHDIAHEGDDVQCPARNTAGKIKCD
ncbi:PAAR domain-containing protein [Paraburkholderia nodosa]|uniref:PAAR domain-containing protein n=1 Tax=Paraburkholderia nodosa TaxID=392320 RepID=UPI00351F7196